MHMCEGQESFQEPILSFHLAKTGSLVSVMLHFPSCLASKLLHDFPVSTSHLSVGFHGVCNHTQGVRPDQKVFLPAGPSHYKHIFIYCMLSQRSIFFSLSGIGD